MESEDCTTSKVGTWCRKGRTDYTGYCVLCKKELSCDNAGLEQILQHARGKKHQDFVNSMKSQTKILPMAAISKATGAKIPQVHFHAEDVLKAEILWCLQIAKPNFSLLSCEGITDTFQAMFAGDIAKDMQLSRTKASYVLSDGLGPYFLRELVKDVSASKSPFVLHYDEATQAQTVKQMNMQIRYWSEQKMKCVCAFIKL